MCEAPLIQAYRTSIILLRGYVLWFGRGVLFLRPIAFQVACPELEAQARLPFILLIEPVRVADRATIKTLGAKLAKVLLWRQRMHVDVARRAWLG